MTNPSNAQSAEAVSILVVEDEALLHDLVRDALEDAGYCVVIVSRGEDAIARLESPDAAHRALVTDINLGPGATGWDVARRGREINPALPVVYMSGASGQEWPSQGVPGSALLIKPFAPAQLVTALSSLLVATDAHRALDDTQS